MEIQNAKHVEIGRTVWSEKNMYSLEKFFIDGFSFLQLYFTFMYNFRSYLSTFRSAAQAFLTPLHRNSMQ